MHDTREQKRKNRRRLFPVCHVLAFFLLVVGFPVCADRMVLGPYQEKVYKALKQLHPDWSETQIQAQMTMDYPTKAELLKDIPASAIRERENRVEVLGRVRSIIPGLHTGDGSNIDSYDKVVMDIGLDGTGKTMVFSSFYVSSYVSAIDSIEDFEWLFSNRHSIAGVASGSEAHRQLFYSLVDAQGWLGLVDQPVSVPTEQVVEGAYSEYLLQGWPLQEDYVRAYKWSRASQFRLPLNSSFQTTDGSLDMQGNPHIINTFRLWQREFLKAAARARKYPGYEDNFDAWAIHSLDMLCGLRKADPVMVDGTAAQIATRALEMGAGCFDVLANELHQWQKDWKDHEDPDRPITSGDLAAIALELINGSNNFKNVILELPTAIMAPITLDIELPVFEPIAFGDNTSTTPDTVEPAWKSMQSIKDYELQPALDSVNVAKALSVYLADPDNPADLRRTAGNILDEWIRWSMDGEEMNARYWRAVLLEMASNNNQNEAVQMEVLGILCRGGWGLPVDLESYIDRVKAIATDYILDQPDRSRAFLTLLAVIQQTAHGPGESAQQVAALIKDEFRGYYEDSWGSEKDKPTWKLWGEISQQSLGCDALIPLDIF